MLRSQAAKPALRAPRRRPYSCDACPKLFETPSKLARHYLTHTGQKPFQCQDCSKTFRQLVHLERHMTTHSLPFQCPVCLRHFKNADTFSKHQRLHVEGARLKARVPRKPGAPWWRKGPALPWRCFGCQRTFESEEKRLLHQCDFVNIAANPRAEAQQCCLCDKAFPSRSKLERHFMIHTGLKPFTCALCGKAFRQKAHLKIHQLTHTQEKPFQCSQCSASFRRPEQLIKHEEDHMVMSSFHINVGISATETLQVKEEPEDMCSVYVIPFQCSSCEQCFASQETLDGHTCEGVTSGDHMSPVKASERVPVNINNGHPMFLDPHNVVFPAEPLKAEHLEELEHNDLEYQPFAGPRNILQQRPQQKVKPARKHFGLSHLLPGRPFRNQHLSDNRMGWSAGSMHATFRAAEQRERGQLRGTFHHILHQAQNILLTRRKVRKCDRCEKSFPSMSKLRRHYLIHTGQKPFSCAECGRNFRQSAHLKRHQMTHTEKGQLYRSHIDMAEYQPSFDQWQENPTYQYNQHSARSIEDSKDLGEITFIVPEIKIETVDLPEVIKKPVVTKRARITLPRVRNAKSNQESPLQKIRTRTIPMRYRCNVCSKNFLSPSKLERHHLTHSGQRPYVCQECGKSFRQDPHLKRHMVTHLK